MAKYIHIILLGLSIWLLLWGSAVSAAPPTPKNPDVKYHYYRSRPLEGLKYQRFFPFPAPKGLFYATRMKATANIDDTPEKETVVLMIVGTTTKPHDLVQAFLLINETDAEVPKKKAFFKLFDSGTHDYLDVPAKSIELHSSPFVFSEPPKNSHKTYDLSFKLVDLTGDGTLDIWVEFEYAIVVISFQNGEFRDVLSSYTVPRDQTPEYVDLDNNGTYEIKIPYRIYMEDTPRGAYPTWTWMSLYEWDGSAYVLNNKRFYAENDDFLIGLLSLYNQQLLQKGKFINSFETYNFYIALVYDYRGGAPWKIEELATQATNEDYRKAAASILKKLPPQ